MVKFKVVEKFVSINGEGVRAGQLAVFIRFAGCNLRCNFCDTMWANEENVDYELNSVKELRDYVEETGVKNVTLTGGEPLLQERIEDLISELTKMGLYVEIETNGSVDLKEFNDINPPPVFTMDYKLPGSGMEDKMNRDNFMSLSHKDTVKFVAGSMTDLIRFKEIENEYKLTEKCHVYLSPVFGRIEPADMVEFMKEQHLNGVNLQLQLHKIIWSPEQKGV